MFVFTCLEMIRLCFFCVIFRFLRLHFKKADLILKMFFISLQLIYFLWQKLFFSI